MAGKVSILDIARLARVSRTTVSRVLNDSINVDPETRQRVLQVIEEQRYVPSMNAKGLKGKSSLVGLLMPTTYWFSLLDMMWSITTQAKESRYGVTLHCSSTLAEYRDLPEYVTQTAGIISCVYEDTPEHLVELYRQGLPVVLVDPVDIPTHLPRISVDHRDGAYQATRYLIELGHRRIGHIQGVLEFQCSVERTQGYCDALQEAGIPVDPALIVEGNFDYTGGYAGAEYFFAQDTPPTAIFADNDYAAYGVMEIAAARGIRIPEDLALIGFNDDQIIMNEEIVQARHLALTTMHQPFKEMGQSAVALLLSLIDARHPLPEQWRPYLLPQEQESDPPTPQIRLPTHLVVRNTSGPHIQP